jgi:hypothetical protein
MAPCDLDELKIRCDLAAAGDLAGYNTHGRTIKHYVRRPLEGLDLTGFVSGFPLRS